MIDSTLYGLGRSAGNVPTEIAVAVLERLGYDTGIDLFEVMDVAEEVLGPLMSQMQLYDMMSVTMGYSQFHSSFLPKVAAAANRHGVPLRRLGGGDGRHRCSRSRRDPTVENVAASLPKTVARKPDRTLTSFRAQGISEHNISASLASVTSLLDGMMVTCAKRRARPVLEVVASEAPSPDLVLADLVLAEDGVVLGRATYGSFEVLEQILDLTRNSISVYLHDLDGETWS